MESNKQAIKPKHSSSNRPNFLLKKRTAAFSRWLHNYLSMFSFLIVLFFALTGFTLNHAEWFDGRQVEKKFSGRLPATWVNMPDTAQIRKLEIVELLRKTYSIRGFVSDFLIEEERCSVSFKGPGYSADAFIDRSTGGFQVTELKLGLIAILNDLHKGRDSGQGWSYLIDVSAAFLTLVSLSGLVMLFFLKKKRLSGLLLLIVGGVISYFVYCIFVP